jgi:hypothetical protein
MAITMLASDHELRKISDVTSIATIEGGEREGRIAKACQHFPFSLSVPLAK